MFMERQTDSTLSGASSSQLAVDTQHNPSQNPSKSLCGYRQKLVLTFTLRQKTQDSHTHCRRTEREDQLRPTPRHRPRRHSDRDSGAGGRQADPWNRVQETDLPNYSQLTFGKGTKMTLQQRKSLQQMVLEPDITRKTRIHTQTLHHQKY